MVIRTVAMQNGAFDDDEDEDDDDANGDYANDQKYVYLCSHAFFLGLKTEGLSLKAQGKLNDAFLRQIKDVVNHWVILSFIFIMIFCCCCCRCCCWD